MIILLFLFIILIVLIVIISLAWRMCSRKHTLPCPVWMKWLLDPPFPGGLSPRTKRTINRLDLHPGMDVLDAGCGPGRLSIPIAKIVSPDGTISAMDIQEGMLQEVRIRAEKEHLTNIRFILGGLGEGTLEKNHYDRAVLITVIGEISNREAALREIYQVLRSGGILLIEETIRDPHFQTRSTVLGFTEPIGFVEKKFFGNRFSYTLILEKPSSPRP